MRATKYEKNYEEKMNICCGIADKMLHLRSSCETMVAAKRSTSTNVEPDQAKRLGQTLRTRREALGLSQRQLAAEAGVNDATIVRIERGAFGAPAPDKLSRIAEALEMRLADVFALADYVVPADLPSFQPYLRSRYRDLPDEAIEDLDRAFSRIVKKHGYQPDGPANGEDESP